jgi:hypothetical protein
MTLSLPPMQPSATQNCSTTRTGTFACAHRLRDNRGPMVQRPNFFLVISEMTVLLLGALLVMLSLTRTVGVPSTAVMEILGAVLVYWALRAGMRKEPASLRLQTHIRAGSLAVVGLLMIAMPFAPLRYANSIVILAGIALMARGLAAGLLSLRRA